ncbi:MULTISPECIES: hypothetical protein [Streptomyces]|uniref:Uncharacterized protein n=1 Tax=Streptomyces luteosporeus TaxID=173856 RepID=A0ABN3TLS5_9ACTN
MANPQHPQAHQDGPYDPAGSTQMFRAFVDEAAPAPGAPRATAPATHGRRRDGGGGRVGVLLAVLAAIALVAGAAWLALA